MVVDDIVVVRHLYIQESNTVSDTTGRRRTFALVTGHLASVSFGLKCGWSGGSLENVD